MGGANNIRITALERTATEQQLKPPSVGGKDIFHQSNQAPTHI